MTLHVDGVAERMFARIISDLRSARTDAGLSQTALATGLPFRARALSEWETGAVEPTMDHLTQILHKLRRRLVIIGPDGKPRNGPARPQRGESWEVFERRRLAVPLRNRRLALGLTQAALGWHIGVSRDSVQRWELVRVPPRPIAQIVWAQKLGYSVALQEVETPPPGQSLGRKRGRQPHSVNE